MRTVGRGLALVGPGDTLTIMPGEYFEANRVRLSAEATPAESGAWAELHLRVAVPPDATRMVVMLGIDGSQLGAAVRTSMACA